MKHYTFLGDDNMRWCLNMDNTREKTTHTHISSSLNDKKFDIATNCKLYDNSLACSALTVTVF